MTRFPLVSGREVVRALRRDGFVVVRQKGSHIRLEKYLPGETLRLTVPAHREIVPGTLKSILNAARLSVDEFMELL